MTSLEEQVEQLQARLKESEKLRELAIAGYEKALNQIKEVTCGENQVANDDTEAMGWIYECATEALSTSGGKDILARLERYHRALLFIENDRYTIERAREVAIEALKSKGA